VTEAPPSSRRGIVIAAALGLVVLAAVLFGVTRSGGDAPPPVAGPEMTNVYMTCVPNDSTVTRADDGTLLGRTPLTLTLPKSSGMLTVVVHHDGFNDRRVEVPLFSATGRIDVELTSLDAGVDRPKR
jgi:hypothetical protein